MDGSFDGSVSDSALDAFDAQIAILDADARIIRVNEAWRRFGAANGAPDIEWVGWNYHDECARSAAAGEEHAANVAVALAQILRGGIERRMFAYECSSPTEQRFFSMTITAFDHDGERVFLFAKIVDRECVGLAIAALFLNHYGEEIVIALVGIDLPAARIGDDEIEIGPGVAAHGELAFGGTQFEVDRDGLSGACRIFVNARMSRGDCQRGERGSACATQKCRSQSLHQSPPNRACAPNVRFK